MKFLIAVLLVTFSQTCLAKHIVLPKTDNADAAYDLCANPEVKCSSENDTCIETRNCQNLIVIAPDEKLGFVYHMMTTGYEYVALAFSKDKRMGAEMCVSCLVVDGEVSGVLSRNNGGRNVVEPSQDELNFIAGEYENSTVYCQFSIDNTLDFARRYDNGSDSRFFIVGVSGDVHDDGTIGKHHVVFIPDEEWAFGPLLGMESFYDNCDKNADVTCVGAWSKSEQEGGACLTSRNCSKAYSMETSEDGVSTFHLFGMDVAYMAIAFSQDQKMGSDAVVACVNNGTHVNGILSRNDGYTNIQAKSNEGLVMKEAKMEDGTIYCSFNLDDTIKYAQTLEAGNSETSFYVIGAGGSLKDDGSLGHHSGHLVSEEKWAFKSGAAALTSSILFVLLAAALNLRS